MADATSSDTRHETSLEALSSYCAVIVVGLFILTFIFQNFVIPSGSMEKTLLIGDHVLVDRVNLAPPARWAPFVRYRTVHRGDIIVFLKPGEPNMILVKRVVGIPGDRLHLHEGYVYLNGQRQDEPQAGHPDYSNYDPYRDEFPNVPTSQGQGVTPTWANELPATSRTAISLCPPAATSPWATTGCPVSMAATGVLCRAKILLAVRSSFIGHSSAGAKRKPCQHERTHAADGRRAAALLRPDALEQNLPHGALNHFQALALSDRCHTAGW